MQSSTTLREVVHMINEQSLVPYLSVIGSKNLTWFTRLFLTRRGTWARYTTRSAMGGPFSLLFHELA